MGPIITRREVRFVISGIVLVSAGISTLLVTGCPPSKPEPKEVCACTGPPIICMPYSETKKRTEMDHKDEQSKAAYEAVRKKLVYVIDNRHVVPICFGVLVDSNGSIIGITSVECRSIKRTSKVLVEFPSID